MGRILVVDDDSKIARLLELMFTTKGHDVLIASSGLEALDMVTICAPDLMLLDMMMPHMDGIGVLTMLKTEGKQFPVVLLSATEDNEIIDRAMEMGAAAHFRKPFRAVELYDTVAKFLEPERGTASA